MQNYFIHAPDLWKNIGTSQAPQIIDARRAEAFAGAKGIIPGAIWRDAHQIAAWSKQLERARPIVIVCAHGEQMSQLSVAHLRGDGYNARALSGGYDAWESAGFPMIHKSAADRLLTEIPSLWVTRRRPKIDRIACPWLVRRFIDPSARFLFVDPDQVINVANETGGIPFDVERVELTHDGPRCSFDTILKLFGLEAEPALAQLAMIVRGADTARHDLAPEAAGLHAISLGLSALAGEDDHELLENGFNIYDGLFSWIRHAADERHNWPVKAAS